MRLLLQSMEQEGEKIIHLLVTVIQEGDARELSSIAYRIPTLLKPEAQNSNMSFCLTGHLDGVLGSEEMEQLSLLITRDLRGEQVQSISDGGMVSITGYTPELGDYLRAENMRINLNLAMRYDDYLDKTVIWAGTPLISRQY
ncbi:MAG: YwmB family TATA-box binding protein, partial [Bacillota bacterium]|nr:YwmB family TATA-box binding protein [Bacillota bacterium]